MQDDGVTRATLSPPLTRLAIALTCVFIAWKLVFLLFFTFNTRYVMDEYIQASYSLLIPDGFYTNVDPIKTVLYVYYFDIARLLGGDANQLMRYARIEGLLLAVGMLALCGVAAWRLWRTTLGALFAVAVLLSFSNFMEHSFRVRSDTLAAFFACASLVPVLAHELSRRRALLAGVFIGLAFISTQKAAYAAVAIGLAILVHSGSWAARLSRGALYTAGFLLVLAAYAVYFGGTDPFRVLRMVAFGPVPLVVSGTSYYTSLRVFEVRSLLQNPVAYAICAIGAGVSVMRWKRAATSERAALAAATFITGAFFVHSQPWPYVFVHSLPFLSLFAPAATQFRPRVRSDFVVLAVLAALTPTFGRNIHYTRFDNAIQERTVADAERQLAPSDRYQDGTEMIPTRRPAAFVWWDSMNFTLLRQAVAAGDRRGLDAIAAGQPKLWIFNYRVGALWRELQPLIAGSYVRVYPNVLLTGTAVSSGRAASFKNYWPGRYRVFSADGRPRDVRVVVDGVSAALPIFVTAGTHSVALGDAVGQELFLLPADASLEDFRSLPPPFELFADVYE
jgi:hypothetical protein